MKETSTSIPSLKILNRRTIWVLIVVDALLLGILLFGLPLNSLSFSEDSTVRVLVASSVGPVIAGFMNEFVSSSLKAVIVFWRLKHVLPGHRAFSLLVHKDPRIDISKLEEKLGGFPKSPRAQNELWYRLYRKHEKDVRVMAAHKNFLLYRDCASLTLLFGGVVALCVLFFPLDNWQLAVMVSGTIFQYAVCIIAARNTGERFVENVLAAESLATEN